MNLLTKLFALIFCVALIDVTIAATEVCEKCITANNVACINGNQYKRCFLGQPVGDTITCAKDNFCTAEPAICSKTATPICATSSCGRCPDGDFQFTCIGKSEFAYCRNGVENQRSKCLNNTVCSYEYMKAKNATMCVNPVTLQNAGFLPSCTGSAPTTTTTTAMPVDLKPVCAKSRKMFDGRFTFRMIYRDSPCKSYIYCEKKSRETQTEVKMAIKLDCKKDLFYDDQKQNCFSEIPPGC